MLSNVIAGVKILFIIQDLRNKNSENKLVVNAAIINGVGLQTAQMR